MRRYLLLVFICATLTSAAQPSAGNDSSIYTDTINLSGVIVDSHGKPAKQVFISRPFYRCYPHLKITTLTDSMGKFHLNGIRFRDTLEIQTSDFNWQVIVNGSRTLRLILPQMSEVIVNTPVKIEAAEISKRQTSPLVKKNEDCGEDYFFYMPKIGAEFKGGDKSMKTFITSRLVYPEQSLRNNIEGEVVIQFQISPDGTPDNFTIISGLNKECDQAALKVLMGMPKWKPAVLYGRPVTSTQSLAVEFSIKR